MKDLTVSMPKWYEEKRKEYDEIIKRAFQREDFRIKVYSNVVKKVVVDAYDNGGDNEIYGIYDFENGVFYKVGCDMLLFGLSGDVDYWHKEKCASFGYFTLYTDHVNKNGEYDETYKVIIDSKMNNAPYFLARILAFSLKSKSMGRVPDSGPTGSTMTAAVPPRNLFFLSIASSIPRSLGRTSSVVL